MNLVRICASERKTTGRYTQLRFCKENSQMTTKMLILNQKRWEKWPLCFKKWLFASLLTDHLVFNGKKCLGYIHVPRTLSVLYAMKVSPWLCKQERYVSGSSIRRLCQNYNLLNIITTLLTFVSKASHLLTSCVGCLDGRVTLFPTNKSSFATCSAERWWGDILDVHATMVLNTYRDPVRNNYYNYLIILHKHMPFSVDGKCTSFVLLSLTTAILRIHRD